MKKESHTPLLLRFSYLLPVFTFLFFIFTNAISQPLRMGENATCTIKVGEKYVVTKPNQIGHFNRVYNIPPLSIVPIEVYYPDGKAGEKVVITALDGGTVLEGTDPAKGSIGRSTDLNEQKKCVFNFMLTENSGLFRITVAKGTDMKVVQIWVGPESLPFKN